MIASWVGAVPSGVLPVASSLPSECLLRLDCERWRFCAAASSGSLGSMLRLRGTVFLTRGPGYAYGVLGLGIACGLRCFQTSSAASSRADSNTSLSTPTADPGSSGLAWGGGLASGRPTRSTVFSGEAGAVGSAGVERAVGVEGLASTGPETRAPVLVDHVLKCLGGGREPVGLAGRLERRSSR